jgi:formylmethanofuran dehydrogenase subunit E
VYYIECEDRYVCDDCLDDHYTRCEDCGQYFPNNDIMYCDDRNLCETCYDERIDNEDEEIC